MMDRPWKIVLVLAALFLAGSVTGGFVTLRFVRTAPPPQRPPNPQAQPLRRPVEQWSNQFRKEMALRLNLSGGQQKKIDAVRQATELDLRRLRHQSLAQTNEITERMDKQVLELLTPEQRVKFEEMMKERRERAKRMELEQQQRIQQQRAEMAAQGGARPPKAGPKGAPPAAEPARSPGPPKPGGDGK
jgi:Spy/CpxP family protein refolding chaperone